MHSVLNMYVLFLTGTQVVARVDPRLVPATIRHAQCSLLVPTTTPRYARCTEYRHILRSMRARSTKPPEEKTASSSHINYRYLSTPEKLERMKTLHRDNRAAHMKIERLKVKLKNAIDNKGVSLDREVTDDLHQVMEEEEEKAMSDVQPGSFRHIFWQQQKEAASRDRRGMRWHPAMIKWCIFLRHQSSRAYETLRESGCLYLPSQRTLRDYSQCVKSTAGFSTAVDQQLMAAANLTTCKPWEKLVILLLDEMYVREDLVYLKRTGKLVGFTSLGKQCTYFVIID